MDDMEKTQEIKYERQYIDSSYVNVTELKITNGRCAYGWIDIVGIKYVVIVSNDDGGYYLPKVFACPYDFDMNVIMDVYNQKIQEKFYGYQ